MIDDEELDINLEVAPSLGSEDKYEAKVGTPYEEEKAELPPVIPEEIQIPEGAKGEVSGSIGVLIAILYAAMLLTSAVVQACFGQYIGASVTAGAFVVFVIALIAVLCVREKNALSGKYVLGKEGTVRITARVKQSSLYSSRTKRIGSRGYYVKTITTGAVYKVILYADGREYRALSRVYYEQNQTVYAYVNGKNAYIDEDENKI